MYFYSAMQWIAGQAEDLKVIFESWSLESAALRHSLSWELDQLGWDSLEKEITFSCLLLNLIDG